MRRSPLLALVVATLAPFAAARAQNATDGRAAEAPAADCAPRAALYQAGKGPKLWVLRQGTLVLAENPLRPLSRDEALVLEVIVNGRRATAVGLDAANLRQGGHPKSVEREGREPIRWSERAAPPPSLRVVAEDGRVLLGPLAFGGCDDAPAAKVVADAPPKADGGGARKGKGKGKDESKGRAAVAEPRDAGPPAHLPQGALDGLSLPRGGAPR